MLIAMLAGLPLGFAEDEAIIGQQGKAISFLGTADIQMVEERIVIRPRNEKGVGTGRFASVEGTFLFENLTDNEINTVVGVLGDEGSAPEPLYEFKVSVDDRPCVVQAKEEFIQSREEAIRSHLAKAQYADRDYVKKYISPAYGEIFRKTTKHYTKRYRYTWRVVFPPKKKTKVQNSYRASFSSDVIRGLQHEPTYFTYVMNPDQGWNNPVKTAVVEVFYEDEEDLKKRFAGAAPSGYTIDGHVVRWTFKNSIPPDDITVIEKLIYPDEVLHLLKK
jgi:hypothetical protein